MFSTCVYHLCLFSKHTKTKQYWKTSKFLYVVQILMQKMQRRSACILSLGKLQWLVWEFPRLELQDWALQADMARFGAQECPKDMHFVRQCNCSSELALKYIGDILLLARWLRGVLASCYLLCVTHLPEKNMCFFKMLSKSGFPKNGSSMVIRFWCPDNFLRLF